MRKCVSLFLCMIMIFAAQFMPIARADAEETTLEVSLYGMTLLPTGEWRSEAISGSFSVYQNGENVNTLHVNSFGSTKVKLNSGAEVKLIPQEGSVTKGYMVEESGYTLSITSGCSNTAHIIAYSNSGIFDVYADGARRFQVSSLSENAEEESADTNEAFTLTFETSEDGIYSLQEPIPADHYILTDLESGNTFQFTVVPYRGNLNEIAIVDARSTPAQQPPVAEATEDKGEDAAQETETNEPNDGIEPEQSMVSSTEVPTMVPTATPTAVPTSLPTEVPTPTATVVPTALPTVVPTAEPTAAPTAVPTAEPTAVPTAEPTVEPTAAPTAEPTAAPTAEPTAEPTAAPTAEPTAEPTAAPTAAPTVEPTAAPTTEPADSVTEQDADGAPMEDNVQGTGNLILAFTMPEDSEALEYYVYQDKEKIVTGKCNESGIKAMDIPEGRYRVQINLPTTLYLNSINGMDINRSGKLTWDVDVDSHQSTFEIALKQLLTIQGSVNNIPDGVKVSVSGGEGQKETKIASGTYIVQGLIPSSYVVTLELEEGDYTGEKWNFTTGYSQVIAQFNMNLTDSQILPAISKTEEELESEIFSQASNQNEQAEEASQEQETAEAPQQEESNTAQTDIQETAQSESEEDLTKYALYSKLSSDAEPMFIPLRNLPRKNVNGTASIEVRVFNDGNHNGECGPYEGGLADVEVDLILTGAEDTVVGSTITGSDGMAIFTDLPAGDYIVRSSLPVYFGYGEKGKYQDKLSSSIMNRQSAQNQESAPVHLDVDQTFHAGIGATKACGFSGQVWLDDGDGIRQENEPGQGGVLVEMIGLHNGLTYQILTGEDGYFDFTQLRFGNYKFQVTLPEGYMFTNASKTGGNNRSVFTTAGQSTAGKNIIYDKTKNLTEQNVGVVSEGNIFGTAFRDFNYNGIYDEGDLPLAGVKLTVFRGNTGKDYGTVITGDDGTYIFRALRNGEYRIVSKLPSDGAFYTVSGTGEEANRFVSKGKDATASNIAVGAGESVKVNLGAVYFATISGTAFFDTDFNGTRDAGEKVAAGMTVNLLKQDGSVAASTRTDAKGNYSFDKVYPGQYSIFMKALDGYAFTRPGENNVIVSRGNGEGSSEIFSVVMGETYTGMDAGLVAPGYVSGVFFGDANDNGVQDAEETGLLNTVVSLVNEETSEKYSISLTNSANYRFDAVLPGRYHAEIEIAENAVYIDDTKNWTVDGKKAKSDSFAMNSGEQIVLPPLGALTLGSITGTAFDNPLADGVWRDESKGLKGVSVSLMTVQGEVYAHTETGEDGYFEIRDIRPATYLLSVNIPDGKVLARKANVTLPIESCKQLQTVPLSFKMGDIYLGQMLGCVLPGTLAGDAWLDENINGKWDDGERPSVGETIYVYDIESGVNLATLKTDENGTFANSGMIPGTYRLVYIPDNLTIPAPEGESSFSILSGQLMTDPIVLKAGEEVTNLHLGLMRYTDIRGFVWFDQGGSIEALPGAQLTLLDKDGNELQRAVTDTDGTYTFGRLLPALYEITVTVPEGHVVVESDDIRLADGSLRSVMQYVNRRNGSTGQFELKMGDELSDMNVGSVTPGTLGDFLWVDVNENGLQDTDEFGIPGVTIRLLRGDKEIARTETDQYGFYLFTDLYPSSYILFPELPDEVKPTIHRDDFDGIISVLESEGMSVPVSVVSNAANYNADMGAALVTPGIYPAGYAQGQTQDWTK